MTLREWLTWRGLAQTEFARLIGERVGNINRYCRPPGDRRYRIPAAAVMRKIADVTGGAVTANDFYQIETASGRAAPDAGAAPPAAPAAAPSRAAATQSAAALEEHAA